jgi:hypothetical protein
LVTIVLAVVALAAALIPARRAIRANPLVVLRYSVGSAFAFGFGGTSRTPLNHVQEYSNARQLRSARH